MTEAEKLLALAARCEAASGPDRKLDEEIERATGNFTGFSHYILGDDDQPDYEPIRYTTSLDAALTLLPDGLYPTIDFVAYRCWLRDRRGFDPSSGPAYGFGASVPRVVVAACLRARARGEG